MVWACLAPATAQTDLFVSVGQAGELRQAVEAISETAVHTTTSMKVIGPLDGNDMMFIREMCGVSDIDTPTEGILRSLDLSDAYFVESSSPYLSLDGKQYVSQNERFGTAFLYNCQHLEEVVLPFSVAAIDSLAFANCKRLRSIEIPASVQEIGYAAFVGCDSITSLTLPHSVLRIGEGAFQSMASLEELSLGDGVETVDNSIVLGDDKLRVISLGLRFREFHPVIFYTSPALTDIYVSEGNPYYRSLDGVLFTVQTDTLLAFPPASPIDDYVVPDGVKCIANCAFRNASQLRSVSMPTSLETIDSLAFFACDELREVALNEGLQHIAFGAFGQFLDQPSSLSGLHIPSTVDVIEGGAFLFNSGLTDLNVDARNSSYATGNDGVLYDSHFTEVCHVPCGADELDLPESVTSIGPYALAGCGSMSWLNLPDHMTTIGDCAFAYATGIRQISLGKGVSRVGDMVVDGCLSLTSLLFFPSSISDDHLTEMSFLDGEGAVASQCTLYVMPGTAQMYINKKGFSSLEDGRPFFAEIKEMSDPDNIGQPLSTEPVKAVPYNLGGRRVMNGERGWQLLVQPRGKTLKKWVR